MDRYVYKNRSALDEMIEKKAKKGDKRIAFTYFSKKKL